MTRKMVRSAPSTNVRATRSAGCRESSCLPCRKAEKPAYSRQIRRHLGNPDSIELARHRMVRSGSSAANRFATVAFNRAWRVD